MHWILFFLLSLIWGSSFILIKGGLHGLTAFQAAAVRLVSAGIVLLPIAIKAFRHTTSRRLPLIFLSGVLGSFFPAFLFSKAEENVDSSLAGVLNALTPVFVIIFGALFFNNKPGIRKIIGIIIAFSGTVMLSLLQKSTGHSSVLSILMILTATIMYATNVYIVNNYLKDIKSAWLASMAVVMNAVPALLVLVFTRFFQVDFTNEAVQASVFYTALLGILGTAIASVLFYNLIKLAGPVFSSMVTYVVPIIAILWGLLLRERITLYHIACFTLILTGVFIANKPDRIVFRRSA